MSELRLNRATKEWIIVATERAKRPHQFRAVRDEHEVPRYDPSCPFCPGNERQTPPEEYALREKRSAGNRPDWRIRVVRNKFPALDPERALSRITGKFFRSTSGVGKHEVIIESPRHDQSLATLSLKEVEEICSVYRSRYLALAKDRRFRLVLIFRNHGITAGTSLKHPHSQVIAVPLVPASVRHLLEEAMKYYDDHGSCVFCDMMEEELTSGRRIIMENERFAGFHPFASRGPFETWIVPKKHNACFGSASEPEVKSLAYAMRSVLRKMYDRLGNPDYNLIVRTAPIKDAEEDYYHWYVQILPRLTTPAGFELGSGIYVNSSLPEKTARFMNK